MITLYNKAGEEIEVYTKEEIDQYAQKLFESIKTLKAMTDMNHELLNQIARYSGVEPYISH